MKDIRNTPSGLPSIILSFDVPKFNISYYTILKNRIRKVHIDAMRLQIDEEETDTDNEVDTYWASDYSIQVHLFVHEDGYSDEGMEHNWVKLTHVNLYATIQELQKGLREEYQKAQ